MTERIQVGDLVVLIRGTDCCNDLRSLGKVRLVTGGVLSSITSCGACGGRFHQSDDCSVTLEGGYSCKRSRLKRSPPPAELGITNENEPIKEPA